MTTKAPPDGGEPVAVPQLGHGDTIHITDHDVYRHSDSPLPVACGEADVQVDWVCYRALVIVIVIWHIPACDGSCPAVVGSTVYDADDSVIRLEAAVAA
jgi:hypothetical protein